MYVHSPAAVRGADTFLIPYHLSLYHLMADSLPPHGNSLPPHGNSLPPPSHSPTLTARRNLHGHVKPVQVLE